MTNPAACTADEAIGQISYAQREFWSRQHLLHLSPDWTETDYFTTTTTTTTTTINQWVFGEASVGSTVGLRSV